MVLRVLCISKYYIHTSNQLSYIITSLSSSITIYKDEKVREGGREEGKKAGWLHGVTF